MLLVDVFIDQKQRVFFSSDAFFLNRRIFQYLTCLIDETWSENCVKTGTSLLLSKINN